MEVEKHDPKHGVQNDTLMQVDDDDEIIYIESEDENAADSVEAIYENIFTCPLCKENFSYDISVSCNSGWIW